MENPAQRQGGHRVGPWASGAGMVGGAGGIGVTMSARTTLTLGTGLSSPPHLHAFQGTILKEHVCVPSDVFFLQFHKNMNVWVRKG